MITKREALTKCQDMWLEMAKHPEWEKGDYFKAHPELAIPKNECYTCEYDGTHRAFYCGQTCIIRWPGGDCVAGESPYCRWRDNASYIKRSKYAKEIAQLAEEALSKLPKKGRPT